MPFDRKFAVSSWLWTSDFERNGDEVVRKASDMGFDGIEIPTFNGRLDVPKIRDWLSTANKKLEPIIIGGGSTEADMSSSELTAHKNGMKFIQNCIESCNKLGGSLVCGPLYTVVGDVEYLSLPEKDGAYSRISRGFYQLGKIAAEFGIKIALEPLCRYDTHLVNTSADMVRIVKLIGMQNVGVLLDTFHLNIEEKSFSSAIEQAGPKLFHFHASENDRGTPGSGLVDWDEVGRSINKIEYRGWIGIESFTPFERNFATKMRVWRELEVSQEKIAADGLAFLKTKLL